MRCGALLPAVLFAATATAATWREDFASGRLDPARWERTSEGDFRTQSAEVVASDAGPGYRLRLLADTEGTRGGTIKHLGIASRCPLPLGPAARVRIRIDWGPPDNGSYLTAALVISPHLTTGDPQATDDWLSIGYVGVPPGRNARLLIVARANGVTHTLYADGWPEPHRGGRRIERPEIEVAWHGASLEVREDDRLVLVAAAKETAFGAAHAYLQLSSHSNYRTRMVHFEDLRWSSGAAAPVTGLPSAPGCSTTPRP